MNAYFPEDLIHNLLTVIPKNQRRLTNVANLHLFHTDRQHAEYDGSIQGCGISIVLQGQTQMRIGNQYFNRAVGEVIAFGADLPVSAMISEASVDKPFLSAELRFDPQLIRTVMMHIPEVKGAHHPHGVMLIEMDEAIRQVFIRLLELVGSPKDESYLASLLQQEIMYRLLSQEAGRTLLQALVMEAHSQKVSKAVRWIQNNYHQSFKVDELANICGMSVSSFFFHFKKMTTLSPLQYQKQLRLEEAHKLINIGHKNISTVAHQVGYKSVSQFCREYGRYFGISPNQPKA